MYEPDAIPDDAPVGLKAWLADQLRRIAAEFREPQPKVVRLAVLGTEPARPRDGMIAYADGTNWDPKGDGTEGFFGYEDGSWVKL